MMNDSSSGTLRSPIYRCRVARSSSIDRVRARSFRTPFACVRELPRRARSHTAATRATLDRSIDRDRRAIDRSIDRSRARSNRNRHRSIDRSIDEGEILPDPSPSGVTSRPSRTTRAPVARGRACARRTSADSSKRQPYPRPRAWRYFPTTSRDVVVVAWCVDDSRLVVDRPRASDDDVRRPRSSVVCLRITQSDESTTEGLTLGEKRPILRPPRARSPRDVDALSSTIVIHRSLDRTRVVREFSLRASAFPRSASIVERTPGRRREASRGVERVSGEEAREDHHDDDDVENVRVRARARDRRSGAYAMCLCVDVRDDV